MKKKIILTILSALLLFCVWVWYSNSVITINKIEISSERVPSLFVDFKIAQISDLHNTEFGKENNKLLKLLKNEKPDIIAITGDVIDAFKTDTEISLNFLKQATELAPTYFVRGKQGAGVQKYQKFKQDLKNNGVIVLENEKVVFEKSGQKINIIGIEDPLFLKERSTEEIIKSLSDENYTIVLAHRPELFNSYTKTGVDLVLTGHAHGGQFRLPFIGGVIAPGQGLFPELDGGLYKKDSMHMIVSRGLGNSIIPFRINNPPEIIIAELKNKQ